MIDLTQGELATLLLHSFLCGIALGLIYDGIRAFKMIFGVDYCHAKTEYGKSRNALIFVITFFTDLLFWSLVGIVAIFMAYSLGGFFRGMILIGMSGGFLIYYFTVGKLILLLNRRITKLFFMLIKRITPAFLKPIKVICARIILLYHLTISSIIDKIIKNRKNKENSENGAGEMHQPTISECGKEDFVYVNGKTRYKRDGRVSFGRRVE